MGYLHIIWHKLACDNLKFTNKNNDRGIIAIATKFKHYSLQVCYDLLMWSITTGAKSNGKQKKMDAKLLSKKCVKL